MNYLEKRNFVYRIVLTILSIICSGDLFYILFSQSGKNNLAGGPHDSYIPLILYAVLFLASALFYWMLDSRVIRVVQNIILILLLGLTVSSCISGWPAMIVTGSPWFFYFNEIILNLTIILGFVYTNINEFTSKKRILLFCLKFLNTLLAISIAVYLMLIVMTSGDTFLLMSPTAETWALLGMYFWMLLNILEAIFIWTRYYRSWWAWLCTVIITLEACVPIIYTYYLGNSIWSGILISVVICLLTLGMTYLNNRVNN